MKNLDQNLTNVSDLSVSMNKNVQSVDNSPSIMTRSLWHMKEDFKSLIEEL